VQTVADRIVFIDRDGVLNEDLIGDYIKRREDFKWIDGAVDALKKLAANEFKIIIISNQAGIGDGEFSEAELEVVTDGMLGDLKRQGVFVADVLYCLHGKQAGCECRKPRTGLFQQAEEKYRFNPGTTFFVGDKLSDVQAGLAFGLRTLFVRTGHGAADEPKLKTLAEEPDGKFENIQEAVDYILARSKTGCQSG
jgi:D-glycero-D-manno-heptose 1,7-bisphosphate phosphatase